MEFAFESDKSRQRVVIERERKAFDAYALFDSVADGDVFEWTVTIKDRSGRLVDRKAFSALEEAFGFFNDHSKNSFENWRELRLNREGRWY